MIFWTKSAKKRVFRSKTEKVNITIEFCIFRLVLVRNSSLNWQFWNFCPKRVFSVENKKNRTCACVHGRYLLYLTFPHGDRQTQRYFNVSFPSSCRDNVRMRPRKIIRREVMFPLKKMKIFKMEKKNEEEKNDLFLLIMQLIFPAQKLQS